MTKIELVFIPSPGLSHLISTVEAAELLLDRDRRLAATVLIPKLTSAAAALQFSSDRLRLLDLPALAADEEAAAPPPPAGVPDFSEKEAAQVREAISDLIEKSAADRSHHVAGLVLDMFCSKFVEIARELGLKSYVFFTSGAAGLGLSQHLVALRFEMNQDLTRYKNSDLELSMPYFASPVPARVLPAASIDAAGDFDFLNFFKRVGESDGIMVNTFYDLESRAIDALLNDGRTPRVYPMGPILSKKPQLFDEGNDDGLKKWLDDQPDKSVIFLCFGTMGSLHEKQVKEIAVALESSGYRFLWSLRKAGARGARQMVVEYEDFDNVLPVGFLERTRGVGRVIGWAPQVAVLAHPAVGGFVSHCGWNSILESVWSGVPIATFPLYAEQQLNAFELVKELGMAEVIRLDYSVDFRGDGEPVIVGAGEIEAALRRLMGGGVRPKVEEMKRKGREALEEGGSSYKALTMFIEDVIRNIGL